MCVSWDESAPPTALRRPLQMTPRHLIALPTAGTHPEAPSWAAHLHLPQPPRPYQLPPACSFADAHMFGCGCVSVLPRSGGCTRSRESLYEVPSLLRAMKSAFALTSALGRHLTGLTKDGRDDDGQGPVPTTHTQRCAKAQAVWGEGCVGGAGSPSHTATGVCYGTPTHVMQVGCARCTPAIHQVARRHT